MSFESHRERYGIVWAAAIVSAVMTIGGSTLVVTRAWDGKASKVYVDNAMAFHISEEKKIYEELKLSVDAILAGQLRAELDRLYTYRCRDKDNHSLDETIRRLEVDYREIMGFSYVKPTCRELL